ncbi:LysR family transcriptional regulator [Novosphingobium profundi]|uniref:LysR family transcriptional regulator n=1 Tax=Novosphingobium profundi TaxID=1774954 RepID=UPI001BDA4D69|nr:LysR family transcriptional regulator [Novosphingobium profundi]MBT0670163.1 LysR family transcriptional regulator [Novosphingobium profundi]
MSTLNWDDLRLFLAVARSGRLAAAGRGLGLDHSTIARRLSGLEAAVGSRLFDRGPRGVQLTDAGQGLLDHAERIEGEIAAAAEKLGGGDARVRGAVRLATPEAFGTYLVAPSAERLHRAHPELRLELAPESQRVSLANRDADIAVFLHQPTSGPIVARHLTDYRLGLYASHAYLERHGPIRRDELARHPFAWYIDARIDIPELRFLSEVSADATPVFRSTSINAQHAAVAGGLGLGILHLFAAERDPALVRVLPEAVEITRSYWLGFHADHQRLPRVRAVVDFLGALVAENRALF